MTAQPELASKTKACINLIGHTGAEQFQIRYHDDEQPVVWIAVALYPGDQRFECAAGRDPDVAVRRLAEQLVDGGTCTHCKRPSGLEPDHLGDMPADDLVCWYQWDPELATYRRACEGTT